MDRSVSTPRVGAAWLIVAVLAFASCTASVAAMSCIWNGGASEANEPLGWGGDCDGSTMAPGASDEAVFPSGSYDVHIVGTVSWGTATFQSDSTNLICDYAGSSLTIGAASIAAMKLVTVKHEYSTTISVKVTSTASDSKIVYDTSTYADLSGIPIAHFDVALHNGAQFAVYNHGMKDTAVVFDASSFLQGTIAILSSGATTATVSFAFSSATTQPFTLTQGYVNPVTLTSSVSMSLSGLFMSDSGGTGIINIGSNVRFAGTTAGIFPITLGLNGGTLTAVAVISTDTTIIMTGTGYIDSTGATLTIPHSSSLSGTPAITVSGGGTVIFSDHQIGIGGSITASSSSVTMTVTVTAGLTTFSGSGTGLVNFASGTVTSPGTVTLAGSGGLIVMGTLSGTGLVRLNNCAVGGLTVSSTAPVFNPSTIYLLGSLTLSDSGATIAATAFVVLATATISVPTAITNTAASISFDLTCGGCTLTINTPSVGWTGSNALDGGTANTLVLTAYSTVATVTVSTAGSKVILNKATSTVPITVTASTAIIELGSGVTSSSAVSTGSNVVTVQRTSGTAVFSSTVTLTGQLIVKTGVSLSGLINSVTGTNRVTFESGSKIVGSATLTGLGAFETQSGTGTVTVDTTAGPITISKLLLSSSIVLAVVGSASNSLTISTLTASTSTTGITSASGVPVIISGGSIDAATFVGPATFTFTAAPTFTGLGPSFTSTSAIVFNAATTFSLVSFASNSAVTIAGTDGDSIRAGALNVASLNVAAGASLVFSAAVTSAVTSLTVNGGATLRSSSASPATVNAQTVSLQTSATVPVVLQKILVSASTNVDIVAASVGFSSVSLSSGAILSTPPPNGLRVTYGGGNDGTGRIVTVYADSNLALLDFGASPVDYVTYPGQTNVGLVNLTACFNAFPSGALPGTVTHTPPFACHPFSSSAELISSSVQPLSSTALHSSSAELVSSSAEPVSSSAEQLSSSAQALPLSSSAAAAAATGHLSSSAAVVAPLSSTAVTPAGVSSTAVAAGGAASSSAAAAPAGPSSSSAVPAPAGPSSSSAVAAPAGPSSSAVSSSNAPSSSAAPSGCSSSPCRNGGTCVDDANSAYHCMCAMDVPLGSAIGNWTGSVCDAYVSNSAPPALRPQYTRIVLHFGVPLSAVPNMNAFLDAVKTELATASGAPASRFEPVWVQAEDAALVTSGRRSSVLLRRRLHLQAANSGFRVLVDVADPPTATDMSTATILSNLDDHLSSSIGGIAVNSNSALSCTSANGAAVDCGTETVDPQTNSPDSALSPGAIALIVIAVVVFVVIATYFLVRSRSNDRNRVNQTKITPTGGAAGHQPQPLTGATEMTNAAPAPAPVNNFVSSYPTPAGAVASGKEYNLPDGYFLKADGTIIDYLGTVRSSWPDFAAFWANRTANAGARGAGSIGGATPVLPPVPQPPPSSTV